MRPTPLAGGIHIMGCAAGKRVTASPELSSSPSSSNSSVKKENGLPNNNKHGEWHLLHAAK